MLLMLMFYFSIMPESRGVAFILEIGVIWMRIKKFRLNPEELGSLYQIAVVPQKEWIHNFGCS